MVQAADLGNGDNLTGIAMLDRWIGYSARTSLPVHPLQLYFIGLSLAAAAIAMPSVTEP